GDAIRRVTSSDLVDDSHQGAEMQRRATFVLREHATLRVEHRRGAVSALLDVRGVCGAHERLAHLLHNGREGRPDHLDQHGIVVHCPTSTTMLRNASISATSPGSSSVVVSICSITAGPTSRFPASSLERSYTGHSTKPPLSGR